MTDESFAALDPGKQDEHWLKQASLMQRFVRKSAAAHNRHAEAKANLELVEAKLRRRIRREPEQFGILSPKPTESMITEATVVSPKYQLALHQVNKAKYEVDLLNGVVTTLEHKKRALENLVTLHGQGYFALPRAGDHGDKLRKRSIRSKGK